ncbi:MAG: hypothetical protein QXT43_02860 [Candidatus Micrarchaeaceae archaeon]
MAKANVPWSEDTDRFVKDLDDSINKNYSVSFRDLLLNPGKYLAKKDFQSTFSSISKDVDAYFDGLLAQYKDEKAKLDNELESLTSQYHQIDAVIAGKASLARIPYIKPVAITRREAEDEVILLHNYDSNVDALVGKLVNASNYVADISVAYKQSIFGSWLFSGQKNYVLSLQIPESDVLTIETGRDTITYMLQAIGALFKQA